MPRLVLVAVFAILGTLAFPSFAESTRWSGWCRYAWKSGESPPPRLNLPAWLCESEAGRRASEKYTPYTRITPFYLLGDFDGDGTLDIAIWVRNIKTKHVGVLIVHRNTNQLFALGAGTPTNNWGPSFSFFDMWSLHPKEPIPKSPYEDSVPQLVGDAIWFAKSESASAFVYWNGKAYVWYQESD